MPVHSLPATRRLIAASLSVLAMAASLGAAGVVAAAPAQAEVSSEASLLSLINHERTSRRLPALGSASDLVSVARYQSNRMAGERRMYHNPNLTSMVRNWLSVGENVGYAGSAAQVHAALMASPPHRANMLSTTFRQVGMGTIRDSTGRLWITQVFRKPKAVAGRSPLGSLDVVKAGLGTVSVSGWALDPDTTASISAHVYVDGRAVRSVPANRSRPDIARAFGKGDRHGFATALVLSQGRHTVCVYGINAAGTGGGHSRLGCRAVNVRHTPIGALDSLTAGPGRITVRGWTIDPDTAASIATHVYLDGRAVRSATASNSRSDLARLYPSYGGRHGYSVAIGASRGRHTVCTYGINAARTPGANPRLGCRVVTV